MFMPVGCLANDTLFQACICMWSKIYVLLYYKSNLNSITRQKYSKHKQTCRYSGCIPVQHDNVQLGVLRFYGIVKSVNIGRCVRIYRQHNIFYIYIFTYSAK